MARKCQHISTSRRSARTWLLEYAQSNSFLGRDLELRSSSYLQHQRLPSFSLSCGPREDAQLHHRPADLSNAARVFLPSRRQTPQGGGRRDSACCARLSRGSSAPHARVALELRKASASDGDPRVSFASCNCRR
eukprot:2377770-Rhodomonas_salina.6